MTKTVVHGKKPETTQNRPDEAARKRVAVELIRNHDAPLRWTARRYSICADDAEDAYQRGIEILLKKAPTDDARQLLPWVRTVIKHEALAIRKSRERTLARPGQSRDEEHEDEDWVQLIPATGDGPDEMAVRRERVARSREALAQLKPAELKALTQIAEGFSYQEIGAMNQWSRTKVNRCLAEGRARFRNAFRDSEAGERCDAYAPLLSACCDGELSRGQVVELEQHLAACGHCRATLRSYRAAPRAAAALAPLLPASHGLWPRVQEIAVDLQLRLQGAGHGSGSGVQSVLASGGTRGAGMAAMAKLAAICAGTAGTAAVCVATGVLPAPAVLDHHDRRPDTQVQVRKATAEPPRQPMVFVQTEPEPVANEQPQPADSEVGKPNDAAAEPAEPVASSTPGPTAIESEFTPEAAGTPAPTSAPPPQQQQATSSSVPVGNGGGEFAP